MHRPAEAAACSRVGARAANNHVCDWPHAWQPIAWAIVAIAWTASSMLGLFDNQRAVRERNNSQVTCASTCYAELDCFGRMPQWDDFTSTANVKRTCTAGLLGNRLDERHMDWNRGCRQHWRGKRRCEDHHPKQQPGACDTSKLHERTPLVAQKPPACSAMNEPQYVVEAQPRG